MSPHYIEDKESRQELTVVRCVSSRMQNVGEQGHMALLGHSLAAYISVLDRERLRKLTTRILSDTTLWLRRLFRFVHIRVFSFTFRQVAPVDLVCE